MWTILLAQDKTHERQEYLDQLSDLGYASTYTLFPKCDSLGMDRLCI
jgi:hypothetical protein